MNENNFVEKPEADPDISTDAKMLLYEYKEVTLPELNSIVGASLLDDKKKGSLLALFEKFVSECEKNITMEKRGLVNLSLIYDETRVLLIEMINVLDIHKDNEGAEVFRALREEIFKLRNSLRDKS